MVQTPKKIAIYKKIENDLLEKIKSGYYKVGNAIQTEQDLADFYNVSRVTVRQATNNLVAKGYLVRNQGSGTFVTDTAETYAKSASVKSFTDEIRESGQIPSTDVLSMEIVPADANISKLLEIPEGALIYLSQRLRKANGIPVVLETLRMSVDKYPDLSYNILKGSKYAYVKQVKKEEIQRSEHLVIPVMPNEAALKHLECTPNIPIIKVLNTTYLRSGEVMDYTELLLNSERYQYRAIKFQ